MLAVVCWLPLALALGPGEDLEACIDQGLTLDTCLQQSVADMGAKYKHGVPELGLPSLDPMLMPRIELNIGANKVKMENIRSTGMSKINVTSVSFDKSSSSINMKMLFKEMKMTGNYTVNILGKSSGPYSSHLRNMAVRSTASLVRKGSGVEVEELKMKIDIGQIRVAMECLFPKESVCPDPEAHPPAAFPADCCCAENSDRGEFMSCNPLLAKATHKAMNRQGKGSMMQRFQPQITGSVGTVVKDYLNLAFAHIDSAVFFP